MAYSNVMARVIENDNDGYEDKEGCDHLALVVQKVDNGIHGINH